jgi:hypothetical protein
LFNVLASNDFGSCYVGLEGLKLEEYNPATALEAQQYEWRISLTVKNLQDQDMGERKLNEG